MFEGVLKASPVSLKLHDTGFGVKQAENEDFAWERVKRECARLQAIIMKVIGTVITSTTTPSFSDDDYQNLSM